MLFRSIHEVIANIDTMQPTSFCSSGWRGPHREWTRERVTSLRAYHAVCKPADDGIEPWLNLNNEARLLQVALKHSGLRRKLVRSRQSTLCRTVPGSSAVPFSPQRRRVPSPTRAPETKAPSAQPGSSSCLNRPRRAKKPKVVILSTWLSSPQTMIGAEFVCRDYHLWATRTQLNPLAPRQRPGQPGRQNSSR